VAAARAEHRWADGQQAQLERLRASSRASMVTLPFLFVRELRRPELERLAGDLASQLAD
jgi:hypothetical protein